MSLLSMVTGASKPFTDPTSLFKNPAAEGLASYETNQTGMTFLSTSMVLADPLFDPAPTFFAMNNASSGITTELVSQVSALPTNLPVAMAAQTQQVTVSQVDGILDGSLNTSGVEEINTAFPVATSPSPGNPNTPVSNICPANHVEAAMAPITQANATVTAGADGTAAHFDNTPATAPLYAALNALPGVVVNNGKELLALLNSPSPAVAAATSAVILSDPGVLNALKSAFTNTQTTAGNMATAFSGIVSSAATSLATSFSFITNTNTVNLLNSTNPCVQKVMVAAVEPTAVDENALSVAQGLKDKTISLPGNESITAANMVKPLEVGSAVNNPVVPAAQMSAPVSGPTIDPYTSAELSDFRDQVIAQNNLVLSWKKQSSTWYKANVEDWKVLPEIQYEAKKTAAGATTQEPFGTSTDPAVIAAWRAVYDGTNPSGSNYVQKRDYFNSFYLPPALELEKTNNDIQSEYKQRAKYGKYPYTYQMAQGYAIPESKQYTLLDSTK